MTLIAGIFAVEKRLKDGRSPVPVQGLTHALTHAGKSRKKMERLGRNGLLVFPFFGFFSSGSNRVPAIHWAAIGSGLFQNPVWVKLYLCSFFSGITRCECHFLSIHMVRPHTIQGGRKAQAKPLNSSIPSGLWCIHGMNVVYRDRFRFRNAGTNTATRKIQSMNMAYQTHSTFFPSIITNR